MNDKPKQIEITKSICPAGGAVEVEYSIKNLEDHEYDVVFSTESCYAFSCPKDGENSVQKDITEWVREDDGFNMELRVGYSHPVELWTFPIETVSLSEGGFEKTYQGTAALTVLRLKLKPNKAHVLKISIMVK